MPFLKWFYHDATRKNDLCQELAKRLTELENQLAKLQEEKDWGSPVIIEHVDNVFVDKMEYSNHFGSLEIDNLQGQLNIGRNHLGTTPPDKLLSLMKRSSNIKRDGNTDGKKSTTAQEDTISQGPKCNIKARGNGK